ncbi:hypothetical protein BK665_17430 [Pseudomonas frederiksbergensis]|uniref:Uncharacterized protein n=2 Tax=Pseudomonas frederiksbergensis TaxID=104087 RepID=A0A423KFT5_9PSED|nr:hypothetical protein BK665_17430 [Pseudomonas frederiksbergensis]
MKKTAIAYGVAFSGLSYIQAPVAEEFTDREIAVKLIAGQRACTQVNPAGNYSYKNFINTPEMEVTDEVKAETLIAETSPDYQEEIRRAQDEMVRDETGRAALGLLCSYYKPPKGFSFW